MTFGSLFAGIGGFDLGLERAGMTCKWQVEIDPYARRVLEKHWPDVRRWDDVRTFPPVGDWRVDLICGGFPCQDISRAGHRAGIQGERSGLWADYARIIGILRPKYIVVENVPALLYRGMGRVAGDLAVLGYDAEWSIVSACAMGAPHSRERLFIVAYPCKERQKTISNQKKLRTTSPQRRVRQSAVLGHAREWLEPRPIGIRPVGVGNGFSKELDRIGALGNAVVPRCAELIGRMIMESEKVNNGP
jgi:DNA (cytosine-5)-methyltransferase 1